MKSIIKIVPILFLAIYSMVMLHSFLPHFHVSSHHNETSKSDESHNHHHGHSSHIFSENWMDTFLDWLNDLQHQDQGENHLNEYMSKDRFAFDGSFQNILKSFLAAGIIFKNDLFLETERVDRFERPPILYECYNPSSRPLRGPPSFS